MNHSDRFKPSEDSIETLLGMYDFAVAIEVTNNINRSFPKKASQAELAKKYLHSKSQNNGETKIYSALAYIFNDCEPEGNTELNLHMDINQKAVNSRLEFILTQMKDDKGISHDQRKLIEKVLDAESKNREYCLSDFVYGSNGTISQCADLLGQSRKKFLGNRSFLRGILLELFIAHSIIDNSKNPKKVKFLHRKKLKYKKARFEADIMLFCPKTEFDYALNHTKEFQTVIYHRQGN